MAFDEILERFGRSFIFPRFREPLRQYLLKAGYDEVPYQLFGILFFVAVAVTYVLFLTVWPKIAALPSVALFGTTLVFWALSISALVALSGFFIWSYLNLRIYRRTKEMEEKLPDYLQLVVTNLRSGMSFDKSLWAAIRPEFGVLGREITIVSKKVMTGNDTAEALMEFAQRYDSPILRRSVRLIVSELESGGEIAQVIDRVIQNLRKTAALKEEMAASVVSYMLFIAIIVMLIAPILFALANIILKVIVNFAGTIAETGGGSGAAVGQAGQLFSTFSRLAKDEGTMTANFHTFSYLALATISLFAGTIVSIIERGDVRGGIKYLPVFVTVTLVLFYLASHVLGLVFSGLLA